ncbi:SPASM domain-containing protein [Helicobacter sp. T3_23-1059]
MKKIYIELSDICNLACSFCPATKAKRGIMGVKDFAHCLKEALHFSRHIALHILGDPCALEKLDEYLNIARKIGLELNKTPKIDIVTSGAFFGKHTVDMLLSPPIFQLSISLEAGVDNFFKKILPKNDFANIDFGKNGVASGDFCVRQNPSQKSSLKRFSAYLDSIIALLCAHKANPQIFLNLRIQDLRTLRDKPALCVICGYLAPLVDFDFLSRQSGKSITTIKEAFLGGNIDFLLDIKGRIRLWEKALLVVKRSFVWAGFDNKNGTTNGSKNPKHHKYHKCYALTQQVGILSNGIVVPCCIDGGGEINLGNVFETPLKQILDCARARNIIDGFRLGEAREELCMSCGFWE